MEHIDEFLKRFKEQRRNRTKRRPVPFNPCYLLGKGRCVNTDTGLFLSFKALAEEGRCRHFEDAVAVYSRIPIFREAAETAKMGFELFAKGEYEDAITHLGRAWSLAEGGYWWRMFLCEALRALKSKGFDIAHFSRLVPEHFYCQLDRQILYRGGVRWI